MAKKSPLPTEANQIEERTAEVIIATPRGSVRAVRVVRERIIVDAQENMVARSGQYAIGRLVTPQLREQTVELTGGKIMSVGEIEEAIALLADLWAEEDEPIYGAVKYLRPIT